MPAVLHEPGCLLYALHQAPGDVIMMIEKWESDNYLTQHDIGTAVVELRARIASHIAKPVVVTRLTAIPVGNIDRGRLR